MDSIARNFSYTLQFGTDRRLAQMNLFPTEGLRRLIQQSVLSNMIFSTLGPGTMRIVSGLRIMPELRRDTITLPLSAFIGNVLFPFGVSFLIPIYLHILVKEKENKIAVMMRLNGLKPFTYYFVHFAHFYVLHLCTCSVFIGSGFLFGVEFFTLTDPPVYILLFLVWGFASIAFAFFMAVFFNRAQTSVLVGFMIILFSVIINLLATTVFQSAPPNFYYSWPFLAYYRALNVINQASISTLYPALKFKNLVIGDEIITTLIALSISTGVMLILATYLSYVIPSKYGNRKPWYFPISSIVNAIKDQFKGEHDQLITQQGSEINMLKIEDPLVIKERQAVSQGKYNPRCPLVINNITKRYNRKEAVRGISFAIEPESVFGLLG
jgi:hypothetical protein